MCEKLQINVFVVYYPAHVKREVYVVLTRKIYKYIYIMRDRERERDRGERERVCVCVYVRERERSKKSKFFLMGKT